MKPISLTIENIRSYRTHEPIVFSDASLIALLGNTGAGKSTLLDAIVLALYGKPIDSQLALEDLMAPQEKDMSVTLRFSIEGAEYEVYRLFRRRGGQGIHRLTNPDKTAVTGSGEVTSAVETLLGLSVKTFLSTVLLPQGRFADLLTATNAKKQEVFRDLFGLDQIDDVSKAATLEGDRVNLIRAETAGARRNLPANPAADKVTQAEALRIAAAEVTRVEAIAKEVTAHSAAIADLTERSIGFKNLASRLAELKDVPSTLAALRESATRLNPQLRAAVDLAARATEEMALAESVIEGMIKRKSDATTLRAIRATFDAAAHEIREGLDDESKLRDAAARLENEKGLLSRAESALALTNEKHRPLEIAKATTKLEVDALAGAVAAFNEAQRIRVVGRSLFEAESAKLAKCESIQKNANAAFVTSKLERDAAKSASDQDASAFEEAKLLNMAAAVASHVHVGDSCPVCKQEIPKSFRPRSTMAIDAAKRKADASKKTFDGIDANFRVKENGRGIAEASVTEQRLRVKEATGVIADSDAALKKLAGKRKPDAYGEAIADEYAKALAAYEDLERELIASTAGVETTRLATATARANVDSAQRIYGQSKTICETRSAAITRHLKALTKIYAPAPDGSNVDVMREKIAAAVTEAETAERILHDARESATIAQQSLGALRLNYEQNVSRSLSSVVESLNSIATLVRAAPLFPQIQPEADELDTILDCLERTRSSAFAKLDEFETQRVAHEVSRTELLTRINAVDVTEAVKIATLAAQRAQIALEQTTENMAAVETLEARLNSIEPISGALDSLKRLLGVSNFKNYLSAQRAARIVFIGSRFLYDMTKRYKFTNEFDILDLHNNMIRPSASLSGGEKFQASLALSLAVVEQAAVGGAKIESLFLDEGFATLDAECLEVAMQELRSQARQGHAIWMITHLRDAAVYAHQSFMVERTPDGSKVRALDELPEDTPDVAALVSVLG